MGLFNRKKKDKSEERDTQLNQTTYTQQDLEFAKLLGVDENAIDVKGKAGLRVATVFTCINILQKAIGKLPLKLYQRDDSGNISIVRSHPLHELLTLRPNPYMSVTDFKKTMEAQRNIYANTFVYIKWNRKTGVIEQLIPIDNEKVKVMMLESGKIYYIVRVSPHEERKIKYEDMIHIKGFTTDGLIGLSILDQLTIDVENNASASKFINNYWKNGVQAKGIVYYSGDLSKENERKLREKFEQMASGLTNSNRTAVLPLGFQYDQIQSKLKDAQFNENNTLSIRQIASAFGIKMHQLNDLERSTHTNITEQQREFYMDTLQEVLESYEKELTYKLLTDEERKRGMYIKFNVDAILRTDLKTRYEAYHKAINSGFLTPNEVRALEEYPSKPNADDLLVNGNMMKVEQAGEQYNNKGGEGFGKEKDE